MPFKWDAEAERNLLVFAIREMSGPSSTIWPAVAEKLGNGLNASACSQKFYKLKKESEKLLNDNDAPVTTPKTAKGSARKSTGTESTGTKRKRNAAPAEPETPTKKSKNTPINPKAEVKEEGKVKDEQVSDEDGELAK